MSLWDDGYGVIISFCFGVLSVVLEYHGLVEWTYCTGTIEGISSIRLGKV